MEKCPKCLKPLPDQKWSTEEIIAVCQCATEPLMSGSERLLVVPLRDCHDCRYCGPDRPEGMILCNHESWIHWDEEMRVFAPDFAPKCESFDARLSRHNVELIRGEMEA